MINAATAHELAHAAIADGRQVVVVIRGLNEQARAVGVFGRVIPVHIEGERVHRRTGLGAAEFSFPSGGRLLIRSARQSLRGRRLDIVHVEHEAKPYLGHGSDGLRQSWHDDVAALLSASTVGKLIYE